MQGIRLDRNSCFLVVVVVVVVVAVVVVLLLLLLLLLAVKAHKNKNQQSPGLYVLMIMNPRAKDPGLKTQA